MTDVVEDLEIRRRPIRRKEREIKDRAEIDTILKAGNVLYLALADNNVPFVVPLNYAFDGTAVYFHSARAGTKIEILKRNPLVSFTVSLDQEILPDPDNACDFETKHRTVVGHGRAVFVEDEADKRTALDLIVAQFTDRKFDYPETTLRNTTVVRIELETIKGKKHGFAKD